MLVCRQMFHKRERIAFHQIRVVRRTKPDVRLVAQSVNQVHVRYLVRLLNVVRLVDTNGIHPNDDRFIGGSDVLQCLEQICSNPHLLVVD
jgi:hypothetical protein